VKLLSYDTETTGLNLHTGAVMFAFSTCDARGVADVVRLDGSPVRQARGRRMLEKLWQQPSLAELAMHDAKFDLTATEGVLGKPISRKRKIHCTLTLARLLRSNLRSYKLEDLLWVLCGYPKGDEKKIKRLAADVDGNYSRIDEAAMHSYQVGDAERCELLAVSMLEQLQHEPAGIRDVYDWERRLIWTTMDMEKRGVYVRRHTARRLLERLQRQTEEALDKLEYLAGERIKPAGNQQVAKLLFEQLGMPVLKSTPGGKPSADKEVLLELYQTHKHPVLMAIIECRSYIGAQAAVYSYLKLSEADGFIHPDVNTCGAQTGRESISNPNLQNVRLEGHIDDPFPVPTRIAFGPRPGYFNLHVDYSGIELRVLVHHSEDPVMTKAFQDGKNPHDLAAEVWYGDRWLNAGSEERAALYLASKQGNYAVHYGAGMPKLAVVLGLPPKEVAARLSEYRRRFPGAWSLPRRLREVVMAQGFVTTEFGRRIYVPRTKPYIGVSYTGQGTAADILKRAQVGVADYLQQQWGDSAGVILPIHDELVIEFDLKLLPRVREIQRDISKVMTDFPRLRVPLKVDWKISRRDWAHLEEIH